VLASNDLAVCRNLLQKELRAAFRRAGRLNFA
jgi:hypothetical protein